MNETEIDEITANLYVDFLSRRGISDAAKCQSRTKGGTLADVEEESEEEDYLGKAKDPNTLDNDINILSNTEILPKLGTKDAFNSKYPLQSKVSKLDHNQNYTPIAV